MIRSFLSRISEQLYREKSYRILKGSVRDKELQWSMYQSGKPEEKVTELIDAFRFQSKEYLFLSIESQQMEKLTPHSAWKNIPMSHEWH